MSFNMSDSEHPVTPRKRAPLPVGRSNHQCGHSIVTDPRLHGNVGTKIEIDIPPDRHELFLLDDGEKKIEYEPETRK